MHLYKHFQKASMPPSVPEPTNKNMSLKDNFQDKAHPKTTDKGTLDQMINVGLIQTGFNPELTRWASSGVLGAITIAPQDVTVTSVASERAPVPEML